MKVLLEMLAVSTLSVLVPAGALAQDYGPPPAEPAPGAFSDESAPLPPEEAAPAAPAGVPPGQWVRTEQYGWVWMPYADAYTYVPPDGYGEPSMYVYCPAFGWSWLVAPWVWGFGPWPYFGVFGPVHFGWYGHGWWRTPERWHWEGAHFHGGFAHGGGMRSFPASRGDSFRGSAPGRAGPAFHAGGGGRMGGPAYRGSFPGRGGFSDHGGLAFRSGHAGSSGGGAHAWGGGGGRGSGGGWARSLGGGRGGGGGAGHRLGGRH